MTISVGVAKLENGTKAVVFETAPELQHNVTGLLKMLKDQFPTEWKSVNYDFSIANGSRGGTGLILPGGSNGRDIPRAIASGDEPASSGGSSGADGAGDVPGEVR